MTEELKKKAVMSKLELEQVIKILTKPYGYNPSGDVVLFFPKDIEQALSLLREHQEDDKCFGEQFIKLKEDYRHALEAVTAALDENEALSKKIEALEEHWR